MTQAKKEERKFQLEQMKIQLLHDAFNSIMSALITVSTSASIALIAIVFTIDLQESVKTIVFILCYHGYCLLSSWCFFRFDNVHILSDKNRQAERTIRREENREYGLVSHAVEKGLLRLKTECDSKNV
jgi:hypothetical protein